jgi:Ser/Thr protein kinase RdoA (MazF antagonist)
VDETSAIFGWPYAVMPRLPGVQLADGDVRKAMSPDGRMGVVIALGECLAALHAADFPHCGAYDEPTQQIEPAEKEYADWFGDWTRWWLAQCRAASDATSDEDVAWVEGLLAQAHGALAQPFVPVLVHTDFKEGNAVADQRDGRWHISGVFDLAEAHAGDGESDLARAYCEYQPRRPDLAAAFVRTYMALRPPRPGFEARFRHYVLRDRLILWEYGQRNRVWFRPGDTLRGFVEPYFEMPAL